MSEVRNKFTIVNRSIIKEHAFSIHRAGCRDVTRDKHESSGELYPVPPGIDTVEDAMNWWLDRELVDLGYSEVDFEIYPCTQKGG
jgi:hypothetical protein